MKFLITFCALFVYCLAATVPRFQEIATYHESQKASLRNGLGSQPRIFHGSPASENQFPYQVSVLAPVSGGYSVCGGSLISSDFVLTAAHCTQPFSQFILRFGSLNLWGGGISLTSFQAINHPGYNSHTLNNDMALVRTPSPVNLSPGINTIQLARASQQSETFENFPSIVSGFGATEANTGVSTVLRWVYMRIISNAQCAGVYGSASVVNHVVCALGYYQPQNQGHCGGDSGGPFTIDENGVPTLIGVVSFGARDGCDLGLPSGYMRTSHFVHWVNQHTNIPVRP